MTNIATRWEAEAALDAHRLQVLGRNGWYDVRRNGATKHWKRDPRRAEVPVKLGLRECFRLCFDGGTCDQAIRVRPDTFDPRNRKA